MSYKDYTTITCNYYNVYYLTISYIRLYVWIEHLHLNNSTFTYIICMSDFSWALYSQLLVHILDKQISYELLLLEWYNFAIHKIGHHDLYFTHEWLLLNFRHFMLYFMPQHFWFKTRILYWWVMHPFFLLTFNKTDTFSIFYKRQMSTKM